MLLADHAAAQLARVRAGARPSCKVCDGPTSVFDVVDFAKTCDYGIYPSPLSGVPVYYHACADCGFIFTDFCDAFDDEDWRTHIYNAEYARIDPDYVAVRPAGNAAVVGSILGYGARRVTGLDYGGGSGTTARLLRQAGHTYDTVDPFGATDLTPGLAGRYDFCSAFEVIEHSPDPRGLLQSITALMSRGPVRIVIGTQVHDGIVSAASRLSWWYVAPRNGHLSIYSRRALAVLAERFGLRCTSLSRSMHVLTRDHGAADTYAIAARLAAGTVRRRLRRVVGLR